MRMITRILTWLLLLQINLLVGGVVWAGYVEYRDSQHWWRMFQAEKAERDMYEARYNALLKRVRGR
jgi:hypothetical protein